MIVLDSLELDQNTAFFDKPTWPQTPWSSLHIVYKFAGFGSEGTSAGNDYGKPSSYLQDGSYATEFGANFTDGDYISPDFEDWPVETDTCPHTGDWVPANNFNPPYDALDNIHQTSLDVIPQINGEYAFYQYGPPNDTTDSGNLCYEPVISQDQSYVLASNYTSWAGYPAGSPTELVDTLRYIQQRARENLKYLTLPIMQNTSFMYINTGGGNEIAMPIDDWREVAQWVFHFDNGLALWYHLTGQGYSISWFDAAVQANVAAIQEEYDKLWTNMIVGGIA